GTVRFEGPQYLFTRQDRKFAERNRKGFDRIWGRLPPVMARRGWFSVLRLCLHQLTAESTRESPHLLKKDTSPRNGLPHLNALSSVVSSLCRLSAVSPTGYPAHRAATSLRSNCAPRRGLRSPSKSGGSVPECPHSQKFRLSKRSARSLIER